MAEQKAEPPPFVCFAISKIVMNSRPAVGGADLGHLIRRQVDDKAQWSLVWNFFGRADDVIFCVLIKLPLVKGGWV